MKTETEIEQLAIEALKNDWQHLYIRGKLLNQIYPSQYRKELDRWIEGYKAAERAAKNISLNPDVMRSLPFPSQKEIKEEAQKRWGDYFQMRDAFELGAEWMKEKLGNGNGA